MALLYCGDYRIESLSDSNVDGFVKYLIRNRQWFRPYEPCRPEYYYTKAFWWNVLARKSEEKLSDLHFAIEDERIVGFITISAISGFPFYSGYLGYSLDHELWGRGLMTSALSVLIPYIFESFSLHRLQANYMPSNLGSARVLEKLGFEREGFAKDYLLINGKWEDHVMTALLSASFSPHALEIPQGCGDDEADHERAEWL